MHKKFEIIDGKKYRKKVRAFILNEQNEFLLIRPKHYKSDVWSFVGGGTELKESLEESVRREINEEVGIQNILSLKKSNYTNKYLYKPDCKSQYDGQIAYYFVVQVKSNVTVTIQNEELANYCWVTFDEIPSFVKIEQQLYFFYMVAQEFGWITNLKSA